MFRHIPQIRCCILLALFGVTGVSTSQESEEQRATEAQLAKYKKANPTKDFQQAWAKSDFRFIGIYGITLSTPGAEDTGFAHLVGIKPIEGTGDAISSAAQAELNWVGEQYAKTYNSLLLNKLRASRTTNSALMRLFQGIEQELKGFEHANVQQDLTRNIKKKDFRFIYLYDTGLEGVHDANFGALKPYGLVYREIKGNKALFTPSQYKRLRRVAQTYVIPYNKMLFSYLSRRSKARKARK